MFFLCFVFFACTQLPITYGKRGKIPSPGVSLQWPRQFRLRLGHSGVSCDRWQWQWGLILKIGLFSSARTSCRNWYIVTQLDWSNHAMEGIDREGHESTWSFKLCIYHHLFHDIFVSLFHVYFSRCKLSVRTFMIIYAKVFPTSNSHGPNRIEWRQPHLFLFCLLSQKS